jgi:hypothetical protein
MNIEILVIELPDPRGREGEKGVRWCKPSVGMGAVVFDPEAAISFAGEVICARAVAVGDETAVQ